MSYRDEKAAAAARVEALDRELKDAKEHLKVYTGGLKGQTGRIYSEEDYPDAWPSLWARVKAMFRYLCRDHYLLCPKCGKDCPKPGQVCLYCGYFRKYRAFSKKKNLIPPPRGSGACKPVSPEEEAIVVAQLGPDNVALKRINWPGNVIRVRRSQVITTSPHTDLPPGIHVRFLSDRAAKRIRVSPPLGTCPHCGETDCWCKKCHFEEKSLKALLPNNWVGDQNNQMPQTPQWVEVYIDKILEDD